MQLDVTRLAVGLTAALGHRVHGQLLLAQRADKVLGVVLEVEEGDAGALDELVARGAQMARALAIVVLAVRDAINVEEIAVGERLATVLLGKK